MVRLKELISIIALLTAIIFQFLMVRLKVQGLTGTMGLLGNFNSLWCD